MASFAARSALRSAARCSAARVSGGVKPRVSPSPIRVKSASPPIFRSPVEMRCVSAISMLPYHTATASALLTSMLSVVPRSRAYWTLEVVTCLLIWGVSLHAPTPIYCDNKSAKYSTNTQSTMRLIFISPVTICWMALLPCLSSQIAD